MTKALLALLLSVTVATGVGFWKVLQTQREIVQGLSALRKQVDSLPSQAEVTTALGAARQSPEAPPVIRDGLPPRITGRLYWGDPSKPLANRGLGLVFLERGCIPGKGAGTSSLGVFGFDEVRSGKHYFTFRGGLTTEGQYDDEHSTPIRFEKYGPIITVKPGVQVIEQDWDVSVPARSFSFRWTDRAWEIITSAPKRFGFELNLQSDDPADTTGRGTNIVHSGDQRPPLREVRLVLGRDLPQSTFFGGFRTPDDNAAPGVWFGYVKLPPKRIPDAVIGDLELPEGLSPKEFWKRVEADPTRRWRNVVLKLSDAKTNSSIAAID